MSKLPDIPIQSWLQDQLDYYETKTKGLLDATLFSTAATEFAANEIPPDFPNPGGADTLAEQERLNKEAEARQREEEARRQQEQVALQQEMDRQRQQDEYQQRVTQSATDYGIPSPQHIYDDFMANSQRPMTGTPDNTSSAILGDPSNTHMIAPSATTPPVPTDPSQVQSASDFSSYASGLWNKLTAMPTQDQPLSGMGTSQTAVADSNLVKDVNSLTDTWTASRQAAQDVQQRRADRYLSGALSLDEQNAQSSFGPRSVDTPEFRPVSGEAAAQEQSRKAVSQTLGTPVKVVGDVTDLLLGDPNQKVTYDPYGALSALGMEGGVTKGQIIANMSPVKWMQIPQWLDVGRQLVDSPVDTAGGLAIIGALGHMYHTPALRPYAMATIGGIAGGIDAAVRQQDITGDPGLNLGAEVAVGAVAGIAGPKALGGAARLIKKIATSPTAVSAYQYMDELLTKAGMDVIASARTKYPAVAQSLAETVPADMSAISRTAPELEKLSTLEALQTSSPASYDRYQGVHSYIAEHHPEIPADSIRTSQDASRVLDTLVEQQRARALDNTTPVPDGWDHTDLPEWAQNPEAYAAANAARRLMTETTQNMGVHAASGAVGGAITGGVSGAVAGYTSVDDNAPMEDKLAKAQKGWLIGSMLGVPLGSYAGLAGAYGLAKTLDSLLISGKLRPDMFDGHADSRDRLAVLLLSAARGKADDEVIQIPAMVRTMLHIAGLPTGEATSAPAGLIREHFGNLDTRRLGRAARDVLVDGLTGTNYRGARQAEDAADSAALAGQLRNPNLLENKPLSVLQTRTPEILDAITTHTHTEALPDNEGAGVYQRVASLADRLGVPTPRVFISNSSDFNATAYSHTGNMPVVVVNQGVLDSSLDPEAFDALMTHELAHATDADVGRGLLQNAVDYAKGVGQSVLDVFKGTPTVQADTLVSRNAAGENPRFRPILATEAEAIINHLAGFDPAFNSVALHKALIGRPLYEAQQQLIGHWNRARLGDKYPSVNPYDPIQEAMDYGAREAKGRFIDPAMEARGYGTRYTADSVDTSPLTQDSVSDQRTSNPFQAEDRYDPTAPATDTSIPVTRDDTPRFPSRNMAEPSRTFYHGTRSEFDRMEPSSQGELGPGLYVSDDPAIAGKYTEGFVRNTPGGNIRPVSIPDNVNLLGDKTGLVSLDLLNNIADYMKTGLPVDQAARLDTAVAELTRTAQNGAIRPSNMMFMLESVTRNKADVQNILRDMGYDGIYGGGNAGTVIFPEVMHKVTNAFTGQERGAFIPPFNPVGAAAGGAAGSNAGSSDDTEDRPLSTLGGVVLGGIFGPKLNTVLQRNPKLMQTPGVKMFQSPNPTAKLTNPRFFEGVYNFVSAKLTDSYSRLAQFQNDVAKEYLKQTGGMIPATSLAAELKRLDGNRSAEMMVNVRLKPAMNTFRDLGIPEDKINEQLQYYQNVGIARHQGNYASTGLMADRDFPGGVTAGESQQHIHDFENALRISDPTQYRQYQAALKQVWDFGDELLKIKRDSGLISPELYTELRSIYPHYVPTTILDHINDSSFTQSGRSLSVQSNTLHALTQAGTTKASMGPLSALVGDAYQTHAAANKNKVFNGFMDLWMHSMALDSHLNPANFPNNRQAERIHETANLIRVRSARLDTNTTDWTPVTGFVNGTKVNLSVHKDLGDITKFDAPASFPIISGITSAFRSGATARNPVFLTANGALDFFNYMQRETGRNNGNFVTPLLNYGHALASTLLDPRVWGDIASNEYRGDARKLLEQGGGNAGYAQMGGRVDNAWLYRTNVAEENARRAAQNLPPLSLSMSDRFMDKLREITHAAGWQPQSGLDAEVGRLNQRSSLPVGAGAVAGGAAGGYAALQTEDPNAPVSDRLLRTGAAIGAGMVGGTVVPGMIHGDSPKRMLEILKDIVALRPVEAIGERIELVPRVAAMRNAESRFNKPLRDLQSAGVGPWAQGYGAHPDIPDLLQRRSIESTNAARTTTLDFAKGGSWSKAINQFIPFFNVGIQSAVDPIRAARDNPYTYTATALVSSILPIAVAEVMNNGTEQRAKDYADVPQYLKDQGMVFMLPEESHPAVIDENGNRHPQFVHMRYRQLAPLAVLTREFMQRVLNTDSKRPPEERRGMVDAFLGGVSQILPVSANNQADAFMSLIPPGLDTGVQLSLNQDTYRNRAIVSQSADERASPLAQMLAQRLGFGEDQKHASWWEFVTRSLGSGYAGAWHGASEALYPPKYPFERAPSDQNAPITGGLYGRVVKGTTGERVDRARNDVLSPESLSTLEREGIKWRPSPSSSIASDIPLTQDEYARYQAAVNVDTQRVIQEYTQHPRWAGLDPAMKEDLLQSAVNDARSYQEAVILKTITPEERLRRYDREAAKGHVIHRMGR